MIDSDSEAGSWRDAIYWKQIMQAADQDDIDSILEERGSRYGDFSGQAAIAQGIKHAMASEGWCELSWDQKEALEMIASKIARILNGDPNYADSWIDIAGYAKLVADRLQASD